MSRSLRRMLPAIAAIATLLGGCSGGSGASVALAPRSALAPSATNAFTCPTSGAIPGESFAAAESAAVAPPMRAPSHAPTLPGRLYPQRVARRYFTNDPFFDGLRGTSAPYFETAGVPGMWDMHAAGLDFAWEYSQANNGSTVTQPLALGAPSVKVAIVDTGEDLTHPELRSGKVLYAKCFITNLSGVQSSSNYVTDYNGHGTDVAGVAAAVLGNHIGFAGAGGKVSIMAYRVFPKPDDNCLYDGSGDARCSAAAADVASAINDAVTNGARVIVLGFGGHACPDDPVEGTAVANAIGRNVIVVASSGNRGKSYVDAPACDPGVIAVGASALADAHRNGSNHTQRGEYAASYSNFDAVHPQTWGLVAPGGDPYCPGTGACSDGDYLHWIYNIYTSTPLDAKWAGLCKPDPGSASPVDCRILIAGTSVSAAHVAGAAALILSVNSGAYGTPGAMFSLLCSTADTIAGKRQGCGRLNVYRAMAVAVHDPSPP